MEGRNIQTIAYSINGGHTKVMGRQQGNHTQWPQFPSSHKHSLPLSLPFNTFPSHLPPPSSSLCSTNHPLPCSITPIQPITSPTPPPPPTPPLPLCLTWTMIDLPVSRVRFRSFLICRKSRERKKKKERERKELKALIVTKFLWHFIEYR